MQYNLTQPQAAEAVERLAPFVTEHKKRRIEAVLSRRTRHLTVVLENVYQPHNAGAVIRTCDCFGIQDLHVIEAGNAFSPGADVTAGSAKWVSVHRHRFPGGGEGGTPACLEGLRQSGYRLVALTLRTPGMPIYDLPLDRPLALCIGTEEDGLSDAAHDLADDFAHVPMAGFTQSLNLSVTAAIVLYELRNRLDRSAVDWRLKDPERLALTLEWYAEIVPRSGDHLRAMLNAAQGGPAPP